MDRTDKNFKPETEGAFTKLKRDLAENGIELSRKQLRKVVKMVKNHLEVNANQYK